MAIGSQIEWTEATWNPVTGCIKVSPGCKHCYAERMAERLQAMGQPKYREGFKFVLQPQMLELPLRWKKLQTIFVNSMSDLFHVDVGRDAHGQAQLRYSDPASRSWICGLNLTGSVFQVLCAIARRPDLRGKLAHSMRGLRGTADHDSAKAPGNQANALKSAEKWSNVGRFICDDSVGFASSWRLLASGKGNRSNESNHCIQF
jgi:hypothetical protein